MNVQNVISFCGTKINTIYFNDSHGQKKNVDGFLDARNRIVSSNPGQINLTLSGGDIFLDTHRHNNDIAEKLVQITDANAIGNHDIEGGEGYFKRLIQRWNVQDKFLGANISFKDAFLANNIQKSKIIEKCGKRIGIIGLSPMDFKKIAFISQANKDVDVENINSTIASLKREVEKLESQDVNIIFLLAHTGEIGENGENYYDLFAKIGGIDVIIGGHDHKEVERFVTSKRGEPVLIASTGYSDKHTFGEDLSCFGCARLEFDDNGVLIQDKCSNDILETPKIEQTSDDSKIVYVFNQPFDNTNPLFGHSEVANLIADSTLWYVNRHTKGEQADFALLNPGTIRDTFNKKEITEDKIISTLPFTVSKLIKTHLTKRQIIETLSHGARSTQFGKVSPGVMHVSGMEYTINPDLSVQDIHILDEDGNIKYNLDDFDDDHEFTCVYDIFLATGVAGLSALKKDDDDPRIEYFDTARQDALIEYLTEAEDILDYKKQRIHKK